MDMDKPRAYVEHPVHGLKMIYLEEREEYLSKGWNRPGQKPEVKEYEAVEPVEELEELSLDDMTKDQLNDFAAVNTPGVKITSRMSRSAALSKIKKAMK
jgi:hypothetical protein